MTTFVQIYLHRMQIQYLKISKTAGFEEIPSSCQKLRKLDKHTSVVETAISKYDLCLKYM